MSASIGADLGDGLVLGGTLALDTLLGVSGRSSAGDPFSSAAAPNVYAGAFFGVVTDAVTFEIALALGGGGTLGTGAPAYGAGGVGAILVPLVDITLLRDPGMRVGLNVRPVLGFLSDVALPGPLEIYVVGSAGVSVTFF